MENQAPRANSNIQICPIRKFAIALARSWAQRHYQHIQADLWPRASQFSKINVKIRILQEHLVNIELHSPFSWQTVIFSFVASSVQLYKPVHLYVRMSPCSESFPIGPAAFSMVPGDSRHTPASSYIHASYKHSRWNHTFLSHLWNFYPVSGRGYFPDLLHGMTW